MVIMPPALRTKAIFFSMAGTVMNVNATALIKKTTTQRLTSVYETSYAAAIVSAMAEKLVMRIA